MKLVVGMDDDGTTAQQQRNGGRTLEVRLIRACFIEKELSFDKHMPQSASLSLVPLVGRAKRERIFSELKARTLGIHLNRV